MYNFGSFDAFIVKPTILPEICSTISDMQHGLQNDSGMGHDHSLESTG